jgi:hypothetical protein
MVLLALVEKAREARHRAELMAAESAHADAVVTFEAAARAHMLIRQQRQALLLHRYATIVGLRTVTDVQNLHATEQMLSARNEAAGQALNAAGAAQRDAFVICDLARETLRNVSLRRFRRDRMAYKLKQEEKHAAMVSEEENVSDELMDRIGGATTG